MDNEEAVIFTLIREKYDSMSKSSKAIADYMLTNNENIAFMSAAILAKECNVSESTVVRFAKSLGYGGYPIMIAELKKWTLKRLNSPDSRKIVCSKSNLNDVINKTAECDAHNMAGINADGENFKSAVDMIHKAGKVYIIGLRNCRGLADTLEFYLNTMRDNVINVTTNATGEIFEQMLHISSKDVVIAFGFPDYSVRTINAMSFANEKNAGIISITDSKYSPLVMYSSCALYAPCNLTENIMSLTAAMNIVNMLLVALSGKYEKELAENIKLLSEVWESY